MTSGCDVCLLGDYDTENQMHVETYPVARKEHRCDECRGAIPPGSQYQRIVGKSDGDLWSVKTCSCCAEIRRVFYCNGGYWYRRLWEDMEEQAFPRLTTASACFQELSPVARAFVLDRWRTWKGLSA